MNCRDKLVHAEGGTERSTLRCEARATWTARRHEMIMGWPRLSNQRFYVPWMPASCFMAAHSADTPREKHMG